MTWRTNAFLSGYEKVSLMIVVVLHSRKAVYGPDFSLPHHMKI